MLIRVCLPKVWEVSVFFSQVIFKPNTSAHGMDITFSQGGETPEAR